MTIPDFIPQVGLRFSFKDTNFEVTYVHNNVVRFPQWMVEKQATSRLIASLKDIKLERFNVPLPHKLLLNGQLLDKTRRAENYIKVIITTLDDYFSHKKLEL